MPLRAHWQTCESCDGTGRARFLDGAFCGPCRGAGGFWERVTPACCAEVGAAGSEVRVSGVSEWWSAAERWRKLDVPAEGDPFEGEEAKSGING